MMTVRLSPRPTTIPRMLGRRCAIAWNGRSLSTATNASSSHDIDEPRPIYVAATREHVGKTSVSLALISGLKKRFDRVGVLKPVGQKCLPVQSKGKTIMVDKDVVVMREHFGLDHLDYRDMSPVVIPRGYTKDYLEGKIPLQTQTNKIQDAYQNIKEMSDVVLCEGTGHVAVGSIVGASNARVASYVGGSMVLVANGGLGSAFDELELNRVLCESFGVPIAGVIVNKVQRDKYQQTQHYLGMALKKQWNIPLLGVIPDRPFLGCPCLSDLERLFDSKLLSGHSHCLRHYRVQDLYLVATSLSVFLESLRVKPTRTLYVCHASREDIILGFLAEYQRRQYLQQDMEAALVVCGKPDKYELSPVLLDMIAEVSSDTSGAPPILRAPYDSAKAMEMIHNYTPKLNVDDAHRVETTVEHYEPYIDFDLLLERTGNTIVDQEAPSMCSAAE